MASRNLGTLTIDLIAKTSGFSEGLSKSERDSEKWQKQVAKDAKAVGKSLVAMGIAGGAATAAMVLSTAELSKEINQLSQLSGIGTQDFQKYAAGARALGIEQDKLADIFKDTSDKVGDFLQTGGGALADYFENIAPKVGQTAEQFRNLSGPQALELYVKGLQEANVSQNEMIFFMEAIASDATLLLPLLKDNASGFKLFADEALKAGAILDEKTILSAQELNAVFFLLDQSALGMKNRFSADLMPVIGDLAKIFYEATEDTAEFSGVTKALEVTFKTIAATVTGAIGIFDLFGTKLAGTAAILASVPDGWKAVQSTMKMVEADYHQVAEGYAESINKIWEAGNSEEANETIKNIVALQSAVSDAQNEAKGGLDGKENKSLDDKLEALRESYLTERELITEKYEEDQALLEEALNNKKLTEDQYNEYTLNNKEKFEGKITAIEKLERKARLNATQSALGDLSSLMNSESRKQFEVGKAAALANAVISGYEAAVHSFNAGAKIGGPALGAAFAASSVAATGIQINAIRSASFGGGSSGAGGSVTGSVNAQSEQVQTQNAQPQQNVYVKGINKDDIFTGSQIIDLVNNELNNGGRLVISE
jgi:hypothetical protein